MEFPHIGKNCSHKSCNKLDFLPIKCDACKEVYCSEHFAYAAHACGAGGARDVQVPQCPLCGAPVAGRRGEPPDAAVGAHMDEHCADARRRAFVHRCAARGCRGRELVPLVCADCALNHCLRHRHPADHACAGRLAAKRRLAADAARERMRGAADAAGADFSRVQGDMSEDEALARALALSLQECGDAAQRDAALARALARRRVGGDATARCSVS